MLLKTILIALFIYLNILAIATHGYLLLLERKYCKHCSWWSDIGCGIFLAISFIPGLAIFMVIPGCTDYVRNITKELSRI